MLITVALFIKSFIWFLPQVSITDHNGSYFAHASQPAYLDSFSKTTVITQIEQITQKDVSRLYQQIPTKTHEKITPKNPAPSILLLPMKKI